MRQLLCAGIAIALSACTSSSLNHALGTPKNPVSPFYNRQSPERVADPEGLFLDTWYSVLARARENPMGQIEEREMRPYLAAGFALSDFYCAKFLQKTDEAYRRRSYGRAVTNDVGTVMQTILGLANAGKDVITGIGAATGLADSTWRQYDQAFLISPDLSNVQGLVYAQQTNFRATTLGPGVPLPQDYATAQSVILRYANTCSFLGMQDLLNRSAAERREQLNASTKAKNAGATSGSAGPSAQGASDAGAAVGSDQTPSVSDPNITPNTLSGSVAALSPPAPAVAPPRPAFVGRWGNNGDRILWSASLRNSVADVGQGLTATVPDDVSYYCPNYSRLSAVDRQLFWSALLSSLSKRESNFNPQAAFTENFDDSSGHRVVSRGLLQISQESANGYGCGITNAQQLHDPDTNLRCGVRILNKLVTQSRVIATQSSPWKGAAAYWSPFRNAAAKEDVASWTRSQEYCRAV